MATMTKPRRRTTSRSRNGATTINTRGSTMTADDRIAEAKKLAASARSKATRVVKDPELERSTRTRRAMKIKAEALDQIARILSGK